MSLPALPLAAASPTTAVLLDLFVLLLAAKIGDELFKRLGQPSLIGEILAGVIVGPSVLGLVHPQGTIEVFAELGVIFLLFWVGLETRLSDLRAVGTSAITVGVLGVVLPFAAGSVLGAALGEGTATSMFLGAALVATSVGITSAVLVDLGLLSRRVSRVILGAAIVDDILAMVLLAVATGIAEQGSVDVGGIAVVLVVTTAFLGFVALGGTQLLARVPDLLERPRFAESPLMPAVLLCLGLAAIAAEIGLAAIIGAFLAGMAVAETKDHNDVEEEIAPLYAFFPPFFFAAIGLQVDPGAFADGDVLALLAAVTVLAIVTKFAGAWLGARLTMRPRPREAAFVGVGMIPRGEVGIIVASLGASAGVIDGDQFTVVVGMSILTTLLVPPLLRRLTPEPDGDPGDDEGGGDERSGGAPAGREPDGLPAAAAG
ncbi:Na+/H+ antiporter [Patulibacter medicamentivorans]|uniref:Na+/H+ antiporter n=1 Tax=Patulibacter medicamentivorans TaxID=1097667 RepID=H0E4G9_9ACTN|nr:cation:proton antiporter [Patulibacter medicamentivorans]EHN11421.1 Na+/H+ antiporter [Patulibacter medicamentivorans]